MQFGVGFGIPCLDIAWAAVYLSSDEAAFVPVLVNARPGMLPPGGNAVQSRSYRRFLILSSPRCGTHMLRSSFSGHPSIVARTELFNPDWNRKEPFDDSLPAADVLRDHVFHPYPPRIGAVGFALHRGGARFGNWPDLWQLLLADTELHVISLRRDDLLRRFVSFHVMRECIRSGQGARFIPAPRSYRPDALQAEFERAEHELAAFDARFSSHPVLRLSYEQLCSDYDAVLRRVHVFLGVEPRAVRPGTSRNFMPPLDELIINWDELTLAFAGSRWAWYFRRTVAPAVLSARAEGTLTW